MRLALSGRADTSEMESIPLFRRYETARLPRPAADAAALLGVLTSAVVLLTVATMTMVNACIFHFTVLPIHEFIFLSVTARLYKHQP